MAKDPAFLFYPGDWNLGTMHMTTLEKGAYIDLLMLQFARDKFTEAHAKHMLNGSFEVAWPTVREKFETDGKYYWNRRLADEKEKRQKFSKSRRNNALKEKKEEEPKKHMNKHMQQHMEDENENINKDEVIYNIEEFILKNSAQLENVCLGVYRTKEQVLPILKSYHLWNQENGKYPKKPLQLIAGLQRWILNEKNQPNATNRNHSSPGGKSAGANEVAERLASKLAARGASDINR